MSSAPANVALLDDKARIYQLENFGLALTVGDVYELRIHENPSTGYSWNLSTESESSFAGIISVDKTYVRDAAPEGYVGVGGQAVYKITALGAGTASFEINEIRPWEPEFPVDHVKIPITVNS